MSMSTMAGTIVFTAADFEGGAPSPGAYLEAVKGGVTISTENGYNAGDHIRVFAGDSHILNFSSENLMSNITFEWANYNKYDGPAIENPNAIQYSVTANRQMRITQITVTTEVGSSSGGSASTSTNTITYTADRQLTIADYNFGSSIASHTFSNGIGTIIFRNKVTKIGKSAFKFCYGLTSITIPESVISIEDGAFYSCPGLTSITIPNSVTSIESHAFQYCSGLTSVTIGNSVTSIGSGAFYECSSLTSITLPNSVTSIGNDAFYGCSSLTSITIPNSVTSIGLSAFSGCTNLPVINSIQYADTYLVEATDKTKNTYSIKNGTRWIGAYAFEDCSNLTSITIPNSVMDIGGLAFCRCSNLTSVTIPNSVTNIDGYAFSNCSNLTSITIPNSVKDIGAYAFKSCYSLSSVSIGASVKSIGSYAFEDCNNLSSVHISNIEAWCNIVFAGSVSSPLYYANHLFLNGKEVLDLVIPSTVNRIMQHAFEGCIYFRSITCNAKTPPMANLSFEGVDRNIPLYVPASSVSAYQNSYYEWREFTNIIGLESTDNPDDNEDNGDYEESLTNTSLKIQTLKVIQDGQLLIQRGGKTYNMQGAVVNL